MSVVINDEGLKEVRYDKYCLSCKHWNTPMGKDPCNECLDIPTNQYSEKPVKFEEKDS